METRLKNTLKDHQLRSTACREGVLGIFLNKPMALSHGDIEGELDSEFDRVTIYRTLKSFLEKGIVHKVLDDEGVRYALCRDQCTEKMHKHNHVHFKCLSCGKTNCIEQMAVPAMQLPVGYAVEDVSVLIQGTCPACNN